MNAGKVRDWLMLGWPAKASKDALSALSKYRQLSANPSVQHSHTSTRGLRDQAQFLGIEIEEVDSDYSDIEVTLSGLSPGLVELTVEDVEIVLAAVSSNTRCITILTPQHTLKRLRIEEVSRLLREPLESPFKQKVASTLAQVNLNDARREVAFAALTHERLAKSKIAKLWIIRPAPDACLWQHIRFNRLHRHLLGLILNYVFSYVFWIISWVAIGYGALSGQFDIAWVLAWVLALLTMLPLRAGFIWQQGIFSIGMGTLIKKRLLVGAMNVDLHKFQKEGIGQLLGRVLESSEFESIALSAGISCVVALLELLIAATILCLGLAPVLMISLLFLFLVLVGIVSALVFRSVTHWTTSRIVLTHHFVENMLGHRTRSVQQKPRYWHDKEELELQKYQAKSQALDKFNIAVAVIPRAWLVVGLLGLSYVFVSSPSSSTSLAITLGAVLLCYRALSSVSNGMQGLARSWVAWKKIAPLISASNAETKGKMRVLKGGGHVQPSSVDSSGQYDLINAQNLIFHYANRSSAILSGCDISITSDARIILEGPSGSGKSTLVSILVGLRRQSSGLLLLQGLDLASWGKANWRRKAILAPQFHA